MAEHSASTPWMQKWTDLDSIKGSSLNRRLNHLPTDVLKQTYLDLASQYASSFGFRPAFEFDGRRRFHLDYAGESAWRMGVPAAGKNAVKIHMRVDLTGETSAVPARVVLSTATVADLDAEMTENLFRCHYIVRLFRHSCQLWRFSWRYFPRSIGAKRFTSSQWYPLIVLIDSEFSPNIIPYHTVNQFCPIGQKHFY
jgi:hypothetical protein